MSQGNGSVSFDTLDDAARAYSELKAELARDREEMQEMRRDIRALLEISRNNGTTLGILLDMAKKDEEDSEGK